MTDREVYAAWFTGPGKVELRQETLPAAGPGDVRIRTLASGISSGTEMLVFRGQVPAETPLDLPTLRGSFGFPIKYGYASVGRVEETGKNVERLTVGDLVFVHHPHQTEYVVPASMPIRLPSDLAPHLAIFFANLETAITVMLDAAPRLGERIAIFGQGVVGLLLTSLAHHTGAELVMAVDPIERRRILAERLGADRTSGPDGIVETVRTLTGGVGADVVIEASGAPGALAPAIDCAAFAGTVVVSSWYGSKPVQVPLGGAFHRGRLHIISSQVGTIDPALEPRWNRERRSRLACDLLGRLDLEALVSHRIPFERIADAYALLEEQPDKTVQVVLDYGGSDV